MSNAQLRRQIKKDVDRLPPDRLGSLADYVAFLVRPPLISRVAQAEKDLSERKGVNWRKVRRNV